MDNDIEFNPQNSGIDPIVNTTRKKEGVMTRLVKKISFGTIKTQQGANVVMVILAIIFFGLSIYFY
jgi:tetrahydromethanopterin S-methyltransferase subunit F